jgi:hypothetical protein
MFIFVYFFQQKLFQTYHNFYFEVNNEPAMLCQRCDYCHAQYVMLITCYDNITQITVVDI